jgi:hypothetical protein
VDPDRVAVILRLVIALIGGSCRSILSSVDSDIFWRMCCLSLVRRGLLQDHAQSILVAEEYQILRYQGDACYGVARSSTARPPRANQPTCDVTVLKPIAPLGYARRLESYGRSVPLTTTFIVGRHVAHG